MRSRLAVCGVALVSLAACTSSADRTPGSSSDTPPATASSAHVTTPISTSPSGSSATSGRTTPPPTSATTRPTTKPGTPHSAAERVWAAMGLDDRVGQLLMVQCPTTGVSEATRTAIRDSAVGSLILTDTSSAGQQAIAAVSAGLQSLAPKGIRFFVAADQEGGQVQRLQGAGFSSIPAAVEQGRSAPRQLRVAARRWGGELRAAGVNLDLAPVLDTVPPNFGSNPPIGDLNREYGTNTAAVTRHGLAFLRGLSDAGVFAAIKHFPGLGRVRGNTDYAGGIVDSVTVRNDAYLAPYRAAIRAHVPFVMMATAIYNRIDPGTPAIFSKKIITGMLRHDLGFDGVVITDDVGSAAQVANISVADRAVRFVAAGGDMVLTVDATQAGAMANALRARARRDAAFRKLVDTASLRVLRAKQRAGLLA